MRTFRIWACSAGAERNGPVLFLLREGTLAGWLIVE